MQIKLHQQIYRKRLVKEVGGFLEKSKLIAKDYFVIIYGSFVTGDLSVKSDMDIMLVTEKFHNKDYQIFKKFVIEIHKKYELMVDIEIPYLNKLIVTYKSINEALELNAFKNGKDRYVINMAGTTKSELASKTTQHRLVLNTLTTPNIFVYGNKNKYLELKKNAELSINKLPELIHLKKLTKIEKIKVLTVGLTGDMGRNHLGYKISRPKVKKYLHKIIK